VSPDGSLTLQLVFSAPLAVAPTVSLGGAPVSVPRQDATELNWTGSVPVQTLGGATQALLVAGS